MSVKFALNTYRCVPLNDLKKIHGQWEMHYLPPFSLRGCKSGSLVGWFTKQRYPSCVFLVAHILPPALLHSHAWLPKFSDASSLAKCMDDIRLQRIAKCTSCSHFWHQAVFASTDLMSAVGTNHFFFPDLPG